MAGAPGFGVTMAPGTVVRTAFAPGAQGVRPMQPGAGEDPEAPTEAKTQWLVYGPGRFPTRPLLFFESLASAVGARFESNAVPALLVGGALLADPIDPPMAGMSPFGIAVTAALVALGVAIPLARGIIVERRRAREEQPKIDLGGVAGREADFIKVFLSREIPLSAHGSARYGIGLVEKLGEFREDLASSADRFFAEAQTPSDAFVDAFTQLAREYARMSALRDAAGDPRYPNVIKRWRIQLEVIAGHPTIARDARAKTIHEVIASTPASFAAEEADIGQA